MTQSRNAPLTARSVIASTLLGMQPPRLDTRTLVRSGALFGIPEGTTRVAVSRMTAAGELVPDGNGYHLAGGLLARQARQDQSRQARLSAWSGAWTTAIVVAEGRSAADRVALRSAMGALRLAERREGVWMRPDNLGAGSSEAPTAPAALVRDQCQLVSARLEDDGHHTEARGLAEALWDLPAWSARALELQDEMATQRSRLEQHGTAALATAFVVSAAVLRHFQADPLLPPELLPTAWPGADLRRAYDAYDACFRSTWRDWYREQA